MKLRTIARQFSRYAETEGSSWFRAGPYSQNQTLRLSIPSSRSIVEARILKAFQPFTNSVTLLVEIGPGNSALLPNRLILKLADRRFGYKYSDAPWSEDGEHKFQVEVHKYFETHGSHLEPDEESDAFVHRELCWWKNLNWFHKREATAYSHLTEAQNLGLVPKFYGQALIRMSPSPGQSHPAIDNVQGMLLEYIPGRVMDSIRVGVDISVEEAEVISQRVLALGRKLRRYGVTHGDIHLGNIILRSPGDSPVLIDWGFASSDRVDKPIEERWNGSAAQMDFHKDIRLVLGRHDGYESFWHRASTPLSNEFRERYVREEGGGASMWRSVNRSLQRLPVHELDLFYYEDESVHEDEGLRWRVKDGVKTRDLDDKPPSE